MITVAAAALIGLTLGHILDLLFERLYTGHPIAGPLYRCPQCRAPLRPAFLLPLFGALWSRGRCPDCAARFPLRAFALSPGAAALFAGAVLIIDDFGPALLTGLFATIFLTLTFTDIERRLIPNRIVYPSILLALAVSWAWPDRTVAEILIGGAVATTITALMFILGRGAFGMGDVKMIVLMGFVVGFPFVLVGIFFGAIAAGAFVLPLLLARLVKRGDYIAYGPFIAAGALVAMFWGDPIWDWYFNR